MSRLEQMTHLVEMINKMSGFMTEADSSIPRVKAVLGANGVELECEGQLSFVSPYDESVAEDLIRRLVIRVADRRIRNAELQAHAAFMKEKK